MSSPSVDDKRTEPPGSIARASVLKLFALLAALAFLLRIFYAGHLYQDDGLWFTSAEEILRGHALYGEIYFDKPPALPLLYALLFKLFGAHLLTVRLFTILYSLALSAALYRFGAMLYDKRAGMFAAAAFTVFSTTYTTGHVQGLNTDFLMALPYTAGACLLTRSRLDLIRINGAIKRRPLVALAGGAFLGVGFQANPKAAFGLLFFAAFLAVGCWQIRSREGERASGALSGCVKYLALAIAGFAAGALPFFAYIAAEESLTAYWLQVWDWGSRYAGFYSAGETVRTAISQTAGYFALNSTLLVTLILVAALTFKRMKRRGDLNAERAAGAGFKASSDHRADVTLLLWLAASYLGVAVGGRFYGHYFFQLMPALCLIAARGLAIILSSPGSLGASPRARAIRRAVVALLVVGFAFTMIRFHGRTVALAADWIRGSRSRMTANWFHERLKVEERMVAAAVRGLPAESVEQMGLEAMREGGPRERAAAGPEDYLFVWGYRPEIYYWSGLLPASRYLSTQPLTGVPADVHYFHEEYRSLLDEAVTAAARAELVRELERAQPRYIIDELGFFNADLSIQQYPELREFMKGYKSRGAVGRFLVYRKRGVGREEKRERKRQKAARQGRKP